MKRLVLILFIILPITMLAQPRIPYQTKKGKWGYTVNGKKYIKPKYDAVTEFENDVARVCFKGKWGVISKWGNHIIEPTYDSISEIQPIHFTKDRWGDEKIWAVFLQDGKKGIVEDYGRIILSPLYTDIQFLINNEERVICNVKKQEGRYAIMHIWKDKNGNINSNRRPVKDAYGCVTGYTVTPRYNEVKTANNLIVVRGKYKDEYGDKYEDVYRLYTERMEGIRPGYGLSDKDKYDYYRSNPNHKYFVSVIDPTKTLFQHPELGPICITKDTRNDVYYCILNKKEVIPDNYFYDLYVKEKYANSNMRFRNTICEPCPIEKYGYYDDKEYYEENIGGDIYSHRKLRKSVEAGGVEFHFTKSCFDDKPYIYIKKGRSTHKILVTDLHEFLPPASASASGRSLRSVQVLSNGDILFEIYAITIHVDEDESIVLPPQYLNVQGQLMCIDAGGPLIHKRESYEVDVVVVDGKTFKPKYTTTLPNNRKVYGVSELGGFYIGYEDYVSKHGDIIKYSNECKPDWVYHLKKGETIESLCEADTPFGGNHLFLSGYTTERGYIGKKNPMLISLNPFNGKLEVGRRVRYAGSRDFYLDGDYMGGYIDTIKKHIVTDKSLGFPTCGLKDEAGKWLIKPVIPIDKEVESEVRFQNKEKDGTVVIHWPSVSSNGIENIFTIDICGKRFKYDALNEKWVQ